MRDQVLRSAKAEGGKSLLLSHNQAVGYLILSDSRGHGTIVPI